MLMLWEWWFRLVFEKLRNGPEQAVAASATHVQTVGRQSQCRRQGRRGCRPGVKSEVSCRLYTVCHYCAIHAVQLAPGTARPGWAARPLIRGSSSLIRRMQSFDTDWQTHPRENKFGLFLIVLQPKSPSNNL